ncbi:MAG: hypothetical protein R6X08_08350 [Desulfosalsimonadaceae bacterium]
MNEIQWGRVAHFGFKPSIGGVHTARTIMLEDLTGLFEHVQDLNAGKQAYINAIVDDNCLNKRSYKTRKLTARHLIHLYSLDPSVTIFRILRYFWERDPKGRPCLALLCTYCRDGVFRLSTPYIFKIKVGQLVTRQKMEAFIESRAPERFSPATLKSVAQNVNSSLTKSGHLKGKVKKYRTRTKSTPGATAYALLLGYLTGARGQSLFETDFIKLLDCSIDKAMDLAEKASQSGWITFKRVGDIIEVSFPQLLNEQEMEWVREQG